MYPPNSWETSETATLYDLQQYAHEQNAAIRHRFWNQNPLNPIFSQSVMTEWDTIWKATWKMGEDSFQTTANVLRDEQRLDDTLLSDVVPDHCNIAKIPDGLRDAWAFKGQNIFIRPEYEEAQRAALWVCAYNGGAPFNNIVFSGSPGTGKSLFLLLLLLRRLAAGLPTGLQIHPSYSILFWEEGVLQFERQTNRASYMSLKGTDDALSRIWVLVDSNQDLKQPTSAFSDRGPFFVVLTASYRPDRINWTKRTESYFFFMKPWSFSEVLQARPLIMQPDNPVTEHALWTLYSDYCPSIMNLFFAVMHPKLYVTLVRRELEMISSEMVCTLLQDPRLAGDASDLLILIEPFPTSRFVPKRRIVTAHVHNLLLQRYQYDKEHEMARFSSMMKTGQTPERVTIFGTLTSGCTIV